jgi:integrase
VSLAAPHPEDDNLPPIPPVTMTKDRQIVDTSGQIWTFHASNDSGKPVDSGKSVDSGKPVAIGKLMTLKWNLLREDFKPGRVLQKAIHLFQLYLIRRMQFSGTHTIRNDFETFRRLLRWIAQNCLPPSKEFTWGVLSYSTFAQFLEHGMTTGNRGNDFAKLRDFYKWAAFGKYAGFDRQLALALKRIRAQGNVKGAAVRFRDKTKGPFDAAERKMIIAAIDRKASSRRDRACVMIHLELGPNPLAVVKIRSSELTKYEVKVAEEGRPRSLVRYKIDLPQIKKRKEKRETKPKPISKELGQLLEELKSKDPNAQLFHWLDPDYPEQSIARAMRRFSNAAKLVSPRTGKRLNIHPRRFRSTLGTEMSNDGASDIQIAGALGHTDTQQVRNYRETSSCIVGQLGPKGDEVYEPVLGAFRGKIIDSHTESAFPGVPPQVIPSSSPYLPVLNLDLGGIGMCGRNVRKDGLCSLAPPMTCYGCDSFAPFRNGPHEEVLNSLETMKASDSRTSQHLDDAIAVAKQLVAQIRSEEKRGKK